MKMSLTNKSRDAGSAPLPKLCRGLLVGIEALEHWDTDEYDEYLTFFGNVLRDLEESPSRQGGFPLTEELAIEDDVTEDLHEIDEFAQHLMELEPEERRLEVNEELVNSRIERAKEIYQVFNGLEREHLR